MKLMSTDFGEWMQATMDGITSIEIEIQKFQISHI